ncbi:DNA photolyase family protein [Haloarcula sp. S1CR25-12]|uniref:DNA photolyase family protein n=1 Tax=Haloarcula saliterrae TaxID=2950534 RepID=A0ABU2FHB4_9EURY|nr:deoxyribodipyrimidine photo-lyase [Haloarcula sp. S1CR25-12]MDS0261095.1 DNA photolyase family protein [Haloarcula sp. S1CR25-12]
MNTREVPLDSQPPDAIPPGEDSCVVWHCRQLRTRDQPALDYATTQYSTLLPVFVFDPSFYGPDGLACDARIQFLHESLADLDEQYRDRGAALTLCHGDPVRILTAFADAGWDIVTTADPTGRYGLRRDNATADACDVTFIDADGLVRGEADSRDGWGEQAEAWLTATQRSWCADDVTIEQVDTAVTTERIEAAYDVSPDKQRLPTGGTAAARKRVIDFLEQIEAYPENISAPADARTGTSQLSPYLRFGCLSVREVYQAVTDHDGTDRATEMFVSRLWWNRHYSQKLVDWAGWMDTAANPVMEGFHADTHDPDRVAAWKQGQTGYPMVDASMRCLKETGWLNFRMRAMCASFLCDLLQQPWKIGADWFYYHLIDADPAINYTQFQIQAGMDGTNMLRIYNPRKQVRDNDSEGEFIYRWVPELQPLPVEHLDQPEKTPLHVQDECGVHIGETYPYPAVEYEAAREAIHAKFDAVHDKAKRALQNDDVARRISMSQRGRVEDDPKQSQDDADSGGTQSSLSSF